jgi:UDP-N-acetylglucosamine acyltransferase
MAAPIIHPTAIVHKSAELEDDVVIEAYAHVGESVKVGKGTLIRHGAIVEGVTTLGENNVLYPYACLGTDPQDLKYAGEKTRLEVGNNNRFREHTSINKGTAQGGRLTKIGDNNLFMATSHVGHDCVIGNHCVFAFGSGLAGHIEVQDHAILGGMTGVHQFTRVGTYSFCSGGSKFGQDIPPYTICQGVPSKLRGLNLVGLERASFSKSAIANIKVAYRKFFLSKGNGDRIERLKNAFDELPPEVQVFLDFVSKPSERGIMHPNLRAKSSDSTLSE